MATTAISRHLRPANRHRRLIQNPKLLKFFSSSSSSPDDDQNSTSSAPPPPQPSRPSVSSYLSDVKASLKKSQSHLQRQQQQQPPRVSFSPNQSPASLGEIRKNLSEFRSRTTAPAPPSLPELYKRNVGKTEPSNLRTGSLSLDEIQKGLTNLKMSNLQPQGDGPKTTLARLKETLKPRLQGNNNDMENNNSRPKKKFPELFEDKRRPHSEATGLDFVRNYGYDQLGEKLRALRPEVKGKNWFSLAELNERLRKLRKLDEKDSTIAGDVYSQVRDSLAILNSSHRIATTVMRQHESETPNVMLSQPNEKLVEKYFHPDNMSSSEKLKIELKKVRDEFKMSESDCGSARVQVAQLTTKIKHLSSALHKKDKHSRKGLSGMVQRRKKLLKYLRRTDWDSYCFVLSKLGLRDNPDYKS